MGASVDNVGTVLGVFDGETLGAVVVASVGNVGTVLGVVHGDTLGAVMGASVGKQRAEHIVDGDTPCAVVVRPQATS